tara:strand:- start:2813 stop:3076 length:264 start_codon:yes stop_codon:yes gene_type:complete
MGRMSDLDIERQENEDKLVETMSNAELAEYMDRKDREDREQSIAEHHTIMYKENKIYKEGFDRGFAMGRLDIIESVREWFIKEEKNL